MLKQKKAPEIRLIKAFLDIRFFSFLIILVGFISIFMIGELSKSAKYDLRTMAQEDRDRELCVNPPDCCKEIESTGDPYACGWTDRGYCTLGTCANANVSGSKCGWYWKFHDANGNEYKIGTNSPNGYGCMIGDSESTMRPKYGPGGLTNTPPVLKSPTPISSPTVPVTPTLVLPPPTVTVLILPSPTSQPVTPVYPTPTNQANPISSPSPISEIPPTVVISKSEPEPTNIIPTEFLPTTTPTPTPAKQMMKEILEGWSKTISDVKKGLEKLFSLMIP